MALMSQSMDGISSNRGNRNNNSNSSSNSNISLGVNRHSSKISKPLKRTSSGVVPQQQQVSKQPPPPPVYNINKNDFRNVVQRLTGSPLPERYDPTPPLLPAAVPAPPPPNSKPPNSRLHKIRPPPLSALGSVTAAPPQALLRSPQFMNSASPFFSPLPPLTPGDVVWAGNLATESPVSQYMKYLQDSMAAGGGFGSFNPSPRGVPPQLRPGAPLLPSPRRPPPRLPLLSPTSQYLLPSPLPSPGSFLSFPSPGQFPMNFFTQSPSGQFGFPGGGPSLPPSPGMMYPLQSPTSGRFHHPSPRWRESESFTFPDPDRRL